MRIEIRDDCVKIDGYVNAVERDSKVLCDKSGSFIEKIKAGAFTRALERAKHVKQDVKVLLNHDWDRQLTSTSESTTNIFEDNIGLRCQCEVRDADVIEKAKAGKLVGWSFGFICLGQKREKCDDVDHREVRELDLREVSILDDTKIPAYDGTSIETRSETDDFIEIRLTSDQAEIVDHSTPEEEREAPDLHEYENRYLLTRANL